MLQLRSVVAPLSPHSGRLLAERKAHVAKAGAEISPEILVLGAFELLTPRKEKRPKRDTST
jgi:hypothetical protein